MGHGGYGNRRAAAERKKPAGQRRTKALTVDKKSKSTKPKAVSLKNHIRSIERMLRKDLPHEVKEAQEKKLEGLKKQQEIQNRLAVERKIFLRNRKIKFFERRKIERRIRRLEKQQRVSSGQVQEAEIADQLTKLKEDLEYVRFFPKNEKYVSLFMGGDDTDIVEKRNSLRKQIKANLVAAAASGKDLEETGSEDDGLLDPSDDDFFLHGSSSDEADADDEWTDKSAREQASSASGKAASGVSSDERNQSQRQILARALMPPPGPSCRQFSSSVKKKSRFAGSSNKSYNRGDVFTSSNTSSSFDRSLSRKRGLMGSTTGNSGNQSSNSDARKPRRKRRPKKKKQQE
ncbi:rRNA-processing protein efg1 [Striga asiatica]|uniref:rRNA-processing protein EFG1 n=1 Tax=Striga asiatica TaxID=4170 RepID=A0A5A7NYA7_STRAF|nr:rRNA-processing protein efg1 [Striga asiatica]